MAGTKMMLSALSPQSDNNKILVRVTRIWEAINKHNGVPLHTNILLLDEKDTQMVATIRPNQKHMFLPNIVESEIYSISNVKVVPGPKLYRVADMEHSANFYYRTKLEKHVGTEIIPQFKFELKSFNETRDLVGNVKLLIDVIGMVCSYGQLEQRTNGARKMDVVLKDKDLKQMVVTLWEEKTIQFRDSLTQEDEGPLFVVITGLIEKKFSDAPTLSSSDATRSFFNIDYAPLTNLKEALSAATGKSAAIMPPPMSGNFINSDGTAVQELTINSILDVKITQEQEVVRCMCRAKIVEIMNGNGWYYICCPKCARTVRPVEGTYFCATCAEPADPIAQRYRIVVRIEDASRTTTLTLFNKEADVEQVMPK